MVKLVELVTEMMPPDMAKWMAALEIANVPMTVAVKSVKVQEPLTIG